MDIFLKTFEEIEFVFHFQTNFNSHIVLNMFVILIQYFIKALLFDINVDKNAHNYFSEKYPFPFEN